MSKETIKDIIEGLKGLDEPSEYEKGFKSMVYVSDDMQTRVAVVKAKEPLTYDVMLIEKIDDIMYKEKLKLHEKIKGKRETAKFVCKIMNGGVK